jgi:hypothetical protein
MVRFRGGWPTSDTLWETWVFDLGTVVRLLERARRLANWVSRV